ncbi:MAG: hypothetical protein IJM75_01210 [Ruminococcus sp.]|nr:hypothetical protein [Ruminococcus sp.]
MNEKFEQYISDLSPEMQEKARECKTKEELNAFIAENDLELPEEALDMIAGGSKACASTGDYVADCPDCPGILEYHDMVWFEKGGVGVARAHCTRTGILYYKTEFGSWKRYE